ncbi:uncharacterized protein LOC123661426 [Melitaea cinxia]|uniref:uncharacterized protein LOC123661426 n=1 Tax=Melitaea cinxia TaxID=113334 RepID=UPI001E274B7F|nr:uncharacterized protein LOC123661426 [Melitaea cinxia]
MRLGKYTPNKSRPIKVFFNNTDIPKCLVYNKQKLPKTIKIYSDQTPTQKLFMQQLRDELQKRTANGEKDLIIKYIKEELEENGNHYLWISIDKLSLNIGAIYKPGETNLKDFLNKYITQLNKRKRSIILGDFNIDLLSTGTNVTQYLSNIQEAGYKIINKISKKHNTRETTKTSTLLDHICTDINNHSFNISIIESALSDHKQIYLEIGSLPPQRNKKIDYQALDYKKLYNDALAATYNNETDDYDRLENFISKYIVKNKINKTKILNPPRKDWINKNIIDSINVRNSLWQQVKALPGNQIIHKKFDTERDRVAKLIKTHKKEYYNNLFDKTNNNPKKMWEVINKLALNKIKDSFDPPKLMSDSGIISNGNEICDLFNTFFSSIGTELASKIPQPYHESTENMFMYEDSYTHNITLSNFTPCSTDEVSKIIDKLDCNTSTGLDGISTKAIKCLKSIILVRLTNCINVCLAQGVYPDTLKIAKVSPIFKSGCRSNPSNYRPISVLPVMSKIFERILYNRLNAYFSEKQFLSKRQYGFRPKSSTLSAVVDLITKIKTNIDKKNIALGIFIDLKKAFDTIFNIDVQFFVGFLNLDCRSPSMVISS